MKITEHIGLTALVAVDYQIYGLTLQIIGLTDTFFPSVLLFGLKEKHSGPIWLSSF